MKISEMINKLIYLKKLHGDLECYILTDVTGDNEVDMDVNGDIVYSKSINPHIQYIYKEDSEVTFFSEQTMKNIIDDCKDEEDFTIDIYEKICTI